MKRIKLSRQEYEKMFEGLKGNLRVTVDGIGLHPTDSKEERLEKIRKAMNPELPDRIQMWTAEGLIEYSV